MTIGEQIKTVRKHIGLTQKDLAQLAGIATITLQQYEAGKREPRIEQLQKIAQAFGGSVEKIFIFEETSSYAEILKKLPSGKTPLGKVLVESKTHSDFENDLMKDLILDDLGLNIKDLDENDIKMIYNYKSLNEEGQEKARERIQELTEIPRFRKEPPQVPADPAEPQ